MSRLDHLLIAVALAALAMGAAAALVPVRAAPLVLDRFLIGFERSCNNGAEYRQFVNGLLRHTPERGFELTGAIAAPSPLRDRLGTPELRHAAHSVAVVTIPLRGTYRGLTVQSLRITRGRDDSTVGDAIFFSAGLGEARRRLTPMIEQSRRGLGAAETLDLVAEGGRARLECFMTH